MNGNNKVTFSIAWCISSESEAQTRQSQLKIQNCWDGLSCARHSKKWLEFLPHKEARNICLHLLTWMPTSSVITFSCSLFLCMAAQGKCLFLSYFGRTTRLFADQAKILIKCLCNMSCMRENCRSTILRKKNHLVKAGGKRVLLNVWLKALVKILLRCVRKTGTNINNKTRQKKARNWKLFPPLTSDIIESLKPYSDKLVLEISVQ